MFYTITIYGRSTHEFSNIIFRRLATRDYPDPEFLKETFQEFFTRLHDMSRYITTDFGASYHKDKITKVWVKVRSHKGDV